MCPLNISAPSLEKNYPCTDQWILHRNSLLWPASVTSSLKRVPENSDLSTFSHLVSRQKMPPSIYQLLLILLWGRWTRKSTRVYYNTFEPYFASISFHKSFPFYLCFNSPKLQASETIWKENISYSYCTLHSQCQQNTTTLFELRLSPCPSQR